MKVVSAQQMKDMDNRAIREFEVPGIVLMENAGLRVVEEITRDYAVNNMKIVVICGRGNNGGDGFVVARRLINLGAQVLIYALSLEKNYRGDALINLRILFHMGAQVKYLLNEEDLFLLEDDLSRAGIVIDALLGTGLEKEVQGLMADVIERINDAQRPVYSVDIPSGVQADSGEVMGCAVKASRTVTFALPKLGLLLYPGASYAGEVVVTDISIPKEVKEDPQVQVNLVTRGLVRGFLPPREPYSHKGTFGHVLIAGGSPGYTGAIAMAGEAALRCGSGLVTVGIPEGINTILETKLTEVMTLPLPENSERRLAPQALEMLLEKLEGCRAAGFGPGLVPDPGSRQLLEGLIRRSPVPLVIDAGGLTLLAQGLDIIREAARPVVLTPHPGEMSRLLGIPVPQLEKKRLESARDFACRWQVTLVLKGAHTITALPTGETFINTTGNPGMASGGTGDVLTGMITSLVGQGLGPGEAAICGVYLNGLAGDMAVRDLGEPGLAATDLLAYLPRVLKEIYDFTPGS